VVFSTTVEPSGSASKSIGVIEPLRAAGWRFANRPGRHPLQPRQRALVPDQRHRRPLLSVLLSGKSDAPAAPGYPIRPGLLLLSGPFI